MASTSELRVLQELRGDHDTSYPTPFRRHPDLPSVPALINKSSYENISSEMSIETINRSCIGKRSRFLIYARRFVGSVIPCTVTSADTYCAAAKPPEAST